MRRYDQSPIHLLDQPKRLSDRGPTWSHNVTPKGGEGGMKAPKSGISLLMWPAGWTQPWGQSGQFEYHTLHEEIFFLTGTMNFDNHYTVKALGYINHPPFWKHCTNFFVEKNDGMVTMLMRSGHQPVVQLNPIPDGWDGRPTFAPATRSIGTRNLQLDDLDYVPLRTQAGEDTGVRAKRVAEDRDDGWTTWVMVVPPGWSAKTAPVTAKGGDEIYLIQGDLTLGGDAAATLKESGYVCDSAQIREGKGTMSSKGGALFVRWTKGAEGVWRVAPQV